jgi:NADPH:quinone reductase-like Zn-dependent oxidoreductase
LKSLVYDRHGEPADVLQVRDVPPPEPQFRQVLVRMSMAPINPSDLMTVLGNYGRLQKLPGTPGYEGVGVVEKTGGGLLGWLRRGKRVAVINDHGGTWQEYCVVPAKHVVPIPDDIPDEQGAMLFVNPVTAVAMTRDVLKVPPGSWLLQTAAGSALGQMVITLGKLHGFRTINVVRRREQAEAIRKTGNVAICEADESVIDRVSELTGGKGVPFVLDPVGGATGTAAVKTLGVGGRALLYGLLSGQSIDVDPRLLITGSKRVEGFWLSDWVKQQNVPRMLRMFRRVKRLLREGTFKTDVAGTYPFDQIRDAVKHVQTTARGGKVLLKIGSR